MSQTLLELVQNYFGGDTVRQTSTALGENESGIGTALRSIIPLVLGGLFARSQQPGGSSELFGMANQAHSSGILGNLSSLLGGMSVNSSAPATDGGLLNRGAEMLRSVFGSHYTTAVEGVSQQAGVRTSTTSSLMNMAVPVVLGLLGKHAADNHLDANGFSSYLSSQKGSIMGALGSLPGGLGTVLSGLGLGAAATGLGNAASATAHNVGNTVSAAANRTGDAVRNTARDVETTAATPSRWPWLLLLLAGLAALFYFMRNCNKEPENTAAATTETPMADTTMAAAPAPAAAAATGRYDEASGNYIYDTGSNADITLPDGTVLNVGSNSFESRLFNFLNDANQTVSDDKTQGWMSLDRVYFNTAKSTLTAESQAQLKNLAAILKAFPNATVKLGGYTDNKGAADMNLTLSADRANAARKAVMDSGIDASRVTAEGYGQEHPIATNDTPEGRAQNRRVDVRVTKK
ncbi:OmpA family protein [Hymenobacter psychrotolerans]|uniref:Outer membrane protein OmpA n=1 Tax=Hymenobacter psychrotolerans DSM 18569 TaxID=1121959 RepID=A0A1M6Y442_9BACT|nr:OmpA family protein [Hymenobacter psychrotolerans]SHL13040.1 Outer membrane protein OmpA [Hymenobacter psychrotolerans DSM 18569]